MFDTSFSSVVALAKLGRYSLLVGAWCGVDVSCLTIGVQRVLPTGELTWPNEARDPMLSCAVGARLVAMAGVDWRALASPDPWLIVVG